MSTDEQWQALARIIGGDALAQDVRFSTSDGRLQHEDVLDELLRQWTASREAYAISHQLQQMGIPASPVLRGPDLLEDPHYRERGTFIEVDHPQVGPWWYPGVPWKMSATPGQVHWAAPTLGQHNYQIYHELLGMPGEEIARLEETGVIGTKPIGSCII